MSQSSLDLDLTEFYSLRGSSLTEFQSSRQVLETVWEVESESEALDVRDSNLLTVDSRDDELLTPPDSPPDRARIIQSSACTRSKDDYPGNMEKFEKIMERMGQLRRETSDLGWGEGPGGESRGPRCNRERRPGLQ
ncbi:hypothetical protein AGABI2DRAFT_140746 [Agaricus bisporus var. bisporus H97]|uniref:hypothetical protein n=1 Tax=Agaricus bisporus var. bisporus (strain H97 / ATCC MYA-4626 / FGSC 10389) TaxID=936046 RepID=UPI00029F72E4|nr:hypothetical protein AGABI2DRAFT_140746 [Agaricus bisporus var. bisporus H97]EKV51958.1 hypothetical protein AGABI2DRAFT_140746 [Agaricus bisporus var. bisporus H97]